MIDTADGMNHLRKRLGWSVGQMAFALALSAEAQSGDGRNRGVNKAASRVLEMERGQRPINGPIAVALEAFAAGFIPQHFRDQLGR